MPNSPVKLRGVYGKPLIKKGQKIAMTPSMLNRAGEIILESVKAEIRKDMAKSASMRGGGHPKPYGSRNPVPIPNSKRFVDSFTYVIRGKSTIEIVSDWPTAEAHVGQIKNRELEKLPQNKRATQPFKMWWLTRPKVNAIPIVTPNGEVIIRATPEAGSAWIHPGFRRYSFIERGVKKGKERFVSEVLSKEVSRIVVSNYNLF
jgi:hypothetical protein